MRLQRVDDRLLRAAQLDVGAVRRACAGGGVRDASVPRARAPRADGSRGPVRRRHPADRPVVVGDGRDGRQLDHRRRAVRTGRRDLSRRWPCFPSKTPDRGRLAHRRHARHRIQRRRHHRRVRPPPARPRRRHLLGHRAGAGLHDADTYRWPMVPALALLAAMPALGSAERVAEIYADRVGGGILGVRGRRAEDKPIAQARLGEARVRVRRCAGCSRTTVAGSKPSSPQAIPCHGRCGQRHGWRPHTSCTNLRR